jgi:acyl carrier protein
MLTKAKEDCANASSGMNASEPQSLPVKSAQAILRDLLTTHFDVDPALLRADILLEEAGLDSLEMVDVFLALEKWYAVNLDTAAVSRVKTIGQLTSLIAEAIGKT